MDTTTTTSTLGGLFISCGMSAFACDDHALISGTFIGCRFPEDMQAMGGAGATVTPEALFLSCIPPHLNNATREQVRARYANEPDRLEMIADHLGTE